MNRLSIQRRAQILTMLTEGNSLRATSRMSGASINTVSKLLADVGDACARFQDVALKGLPCETIQVDEIWSFCYSKQKNVPAEHQGEFGYGDVWTWTAICAETKLVPSWHVGQRTADDAFVFLMDLKGRLPERVQITSDGLRAYNAGMRWSFGDAADWAVLQKIYGPEQTGQRRYSPPVCTGALAEVRTGSPDPAKVSTSYVERQNLTMRMGMRRFTRLTSGFSKKIENHIAAIAIHFMHYNYARPHKSLANPYPRTPAMAAGVADHVWTPQEIVALAE